MPNRIEEFELQSRQKKLVVYNFGPEARDACMAALTLSLENFGKWQNERILPEDPVTDTCDSSQNSFRTNNVDNEVQFRSAASSDESATSTNGRDCVTTSDRTVTPPHQPRKQQLLPPPLERRFNSRRFRSASTPRRPLEALSPTRVTAVRAASPSWPATPRPSKLADRALTVVLFGDGHRRADADVAAAPDRCFRDGNAPSLDETVLAPPDDRPPESVALVPPPTSPARDDGDVRHRGANEGAAEMLDRVRPDKVAPRDISTSSIVVDDEPLSGYESKIKRIDEDILYHSRAFLSAVLLFVIFRVMIF